jgi:hypothetical protein
MTNYEQQLLQNEEAIPTEAIAEECHCSFSEAYKKDSALAQKHNS